MSKLKSFKNRKLNSRPSENKEENNEEDVVVWEKPKSLEEVSPYTSPTVELGVKKRLKKRRCYQDDPLGRVIYKFLFMFLLFFNIFRCQSSCAKDFEILKSKSKPNGHLVQRLYSFVP